MDTGGAAITVKPVVLVVMGVSGCGKSTVAALLSARLGWPCEEGDALHPQSNVEKVSAGRPLTDEDRAPWMQQVDAWVEDQLDAGRSKVITCSALNRAHWDVINRRGSGVVLVFAGEGRRTPAGPAWALPAGELACQPALAPISGEPAIRFDVGPAAGVIVGRVVDQFNLSSGGQG